MSGYFQKLLGTVSSFFQIGGAAGPGWSNNAGTLEAKNAANNALAPVRGVNIAFAYGQATLNNGSKTVAVPGIKANAIVVFGLSTANGSTSLGLPSADPSNYSVGTSFSLTSLVPATGLVNPQDNGTYNYVVYQT